MTKESNEALILIIVKGGLIQKIISDKNCDVLIIDYDTEGADDYQKIPQSDGSFEDGRLYTFTPQINKEEVDKLWKLFWDNTLWNYEKQ